jgi:hypothetical protein
MFLLWIQLTASSLALATAWAGVESPYTGTLVSALKDWPPHTRRNPAPSTLALECYKTPGSGNSGYVGVGQWMTIAAPLDAVVRVLDDFGHYADLFPDLKQVTVTSRNGAQLETTWEEDIPVFFIPNGKYGLTYWVDGATSTGRRTYRYQLAEAGHLHRSDGVIVVENAPGGGTYYTELDFVDADWGLLKAFAPGKIWKETIAGIGRSDLAVALRAEHADWAYPRIKATAKDSLSEATVERCAAARHDFSLTDFLR